MRNDELLKAVIRELMPEKGPDQRGEYTCWCIFHQDGQGKPPHSPNLNVSIRGFYCHACGEKGSLNQLARRLGLYKGPEERLPEAVYPYMDEGGKLLFEVCRYPGKRFRQRRPDGAGGWIWRLDGVPRVLYRLPEILESPENRLFIVEGERDVETLREWGLVATTNPGGAGKWRPEHSNFLTGREVIILADNDKPGRMHALAVGKALKGIARSVKILELPGLPEKGDVTDWLNAGNTVEGLLTLVEMTPSEAEEQHLICTGDREADRSKNTERESVVLSSGIALPERLVALAFSNGVELFVDEYDRGYGRLPLNDHLEIWPCSSERFKLWLSRLAWREWGKTVSMSSLKSCISTLESIAFFEGKRHCLFNRVASHEDEIYIDLSNANWAVVKVTSSGWELVDKPPILFRRFPHQLPLVYPTPEGDLQIVHDLVNLRTADDKLLFSVYLVSCFVPSISHPIAVLHGSPGSGKSTSQRIVRSIVDPSAVPLLTLPRRREELSQILYHHWFPCFDNISGISDEVSDALCRGVTGDGSSKRKLFTDDDDVIYAYRRVIALNGVGVVARRSDLLDRALIFFLDMIPEECRMSDTELQQKLSTLLPRILGGIYNTLSRAMAILPSILLDKLPRMADFALWGCAIAEALGYTKEEFLSAYSRNADVSHEEALEASIVGSLIRELIAGSNSIWVGSATELLDALTRLAEDNRLDPRGRMWPKSPASLSRALSEIRPDLLKIGIRVMYSRNERRRTITIEKEECR